MKNASLSDMMLFLSVVEQRSFSATAIQFGVTKSVVSKRISRLEKELGVQLLYRSTRKLSLSEPGQILFEYCSQIRGALEEAMTAVSAQSLAPQGVLRINCPASFGELHLVPALAAFMKQYPLIQVELLMGSLYEDLIESGIDVAIRVGEMPDSSLIAKRLTVRKMRVCAAPAYLEAHGVPQVPEDLLKHNCLTHHKSPTGSEWHFSVGRRDLRLAVSGNFSASTSAALESAAVNGMGIVMLPGHMMTEDMHSGNLIRILEEYCQDGIGIYAVFQQTRHIAPKVRAFIDFIYARFSEESYWL